MIWENIFAISEADLPENRCTARLFPACEVAV